MITSGGDVQGGGYRYISKVSYSEYQTKVSPKSMLFRCQKCLNKLQLILRALPTGPSPGLRETLYFRVVQTSDMIVCLLTLCWNFRPGHIAFHSVLLANNSVQFYFTKQDAAFVATKAVSLR